MKIIFTERAERRLTESFNYYNLKANRRVAFKIVAEITYQTNILETRPNNGVMESLPEIRNIQYFYSVTKKCKLIDRISEDLEIISTIFDTIQNSSKIRQKNKISRP